MSHDKSGVAVPRVEMFNTQEAQQGVAAKSRQPARQGRFHAGKCI